MYCLHPNVIRLRSARRLRSTLGPGHNGNESQRALWTFLIYALVGPFFAALALVILIALAWVFGFGCSPSRCHPSGRRVSLHFVWSTVPALLTALVLAAVVWRTGSFTWLVAVVVAVIAFAIAAMLLPLGLDHTRPYLAFLAGVVAAVVRQVLIQGDVIAPELPRNQISRLSVSLILMRKGRPPMRWAIATVLCLLAVPASAAMTTDIGVLTCTLAEHGEKGTEPDSQTRAMLCSFKPKGTGPEESYSGE